MGEREADGGPYDVTSLSLSLCEPAQELRAFTDGFHGGAACCGFCVSLQLCAQMGAFQSVDEDALDKAACWLKKEDLLRVRELSPHGRDAARRAIARKWIPDIRLVYFGHQQYVGDSALEMRAPPRAVEAMARVFGAGCVWLRACGTSAQSLAALSYFVSSTNGGLEGLSVWKCAISSDELVAMCRLCPNLTGLTGPEHVHTSDQAIEAIAAACPKLDDVDFPDSVPADCSPAERWQRHFPRLKCLNLSPYQGETHHPPYRPTLLEKISEAARSISATELNLEGCHIFPDVIEAIVGTPVGDRLTTLQSQYLGDINIEPDALLAAARGFPRLTELWIPGETRIPDPAWFSRLAGIRTFQTLNIKSRHVTDSQIVAACSQNPLVKLELTWIEKLTRGVIDGIISSQSAATLQDLDISYCQPYLNDDEIASYVQNRAIRAVDILRLVRACPRLSQLYWQREPEYGDDDQATYPELTEILKLRGGAFRPFHG